MSSPSETLGRRSRAHYLPTLTDTKWRRREMIRLRKAPRQLNSQSVSPSSARSHIIYIYKQHELTLCIKIVKRVCERERGERITRPTLIMMCHAARKSIYTTIISCKTPVPYLEFKAPAAATAAGDCCPRDFLSL